MDYKVLGQEATLTDPLIGYLPQLPDSDGLLAPLREPKPLQEQVLEFEAIATTNSSIQLQEQALQLAQKRLQSFATAPDFSVKMQLAFGEGIDVSSLRQTWASGDFSAIPKIEVRAAAEINGANGAFAGATNTIYLAQEFIKRNIGNPELVVGVLLEEIGHSVDKTLNESDSPGDEGAIFAALVQGNSFDAENTDQLQQLKAEDDSAVIILDEKTVAIEQAATINSAYTFDIIAKTGDLGITTIEDSPSINDAGLVAFVGRRGTITDVFAGDGDPSKTLIDITGTTGVAPNTSRQVQINNDNIVATHDFRITGGTATSGIRLRDANKPGTTLDENFVNVATALGNRGFFNAVFTPPSINNEASLTNKRDVVFSGQIGATRLLATPSFLNFNTTIVRAPVRPMIADTGDIVYSDRIGTDSFIFITDKDLSKFDEIASPAKGFTALGNSPGISDDAQIIVFYGSLTEAGATSLGLTPGHGVFASIKNNSGRKIVRVAGLVDGFSSFEADARVAVNSTHRSEPFTDSDKNGLFDIGETFTDQDNDGVFDVSQRAVTIVYMAKDTGENLGIYSSRLNFFGSGAASFNAMDSANEYTVNRPTLVAEVGDTIPELGTEPITDLNIYDPLNNRDRGDVAFWVKTTTGDEAVVRSRPQEVVYLDFNPFTNFKVGLDLGAAIFADLGVPLSWSGNIDQVFSSLAPSRTDLNGSTNIKNIQNAIVAQVQNTFKNIGANVKILGSTSDTVPTDGRFTRVYIGDSPYDSSKLISSLNGQAASVDLFNQDLFFGEGEIKSKIIFNQDAAVVFVDNIFSVADYDKASPGLEGYFTDGLGKLVSLNQTGAGEIKFSEVITAISNIVIHEIGHSLGLLHLKDNLSNLVMNQNVNYFSDELRSKQVFGTADQPIAEVPGTFQNDKQRLAFTVGSDLEYTTLPRSAPSAAILNIANRSKFSLGSFLGGSSINVSRAALGIVPLGDKDIIPQFIDLGSGDLATLLNQDIEVGTQDQIILIASTDGQGIDIFGVANEFSGSVDDIDLTNGLFVLSDERIRGELFDNSEQPLVSSLSLFQITNSGPVQIGTVGSAEAPSNTSPTATNDTATTSEDTAVNINVLANDSDANGDPLTLSLATTSSNGTVTLNNNGTPSNPSDDTITYTPNPNFNGTDTFTYQVNDGKGGTGTATATVTVNPVNDPPVANPNKTLTVLEDAASTPLGITAPIDADADPLTITVNTLEVTKGEIRLANGTALVVGNTLTTTQLTELVFTPVANANGAAGSFSYTVNDGKGGTATQTTTLEITPVNDAPLAQNDTTTTAQNTPITILTAALLANDSDVDGDVLNISTVGNATNGSVALDQNSNVVFTPTTNFNGQATFDYTISDNNGSTNTATVSVTVNGVNTSPVAQDDKTLTILEDAAATPLGITAPTDADENPLVIAVVALPDATKGVVRIADGTAVVAGNPLTTDELTGLVFTPVANANGAAGSFRYTVSDAQGGTDSQTVTLEITPVNDAPVAQADSATTNQNIPVTISTATLLANDSDIEGSLSITAVSNATNGNVVFDTEQDEIVFTPAVDFSGAASFNYTVSDSDGAASTATVAVTVNLPSGLNEITGTSERDVLTGTSNSDRIIGLQGADTLTGGGGNDQFVYTSIRDRGDTITDFEVGKDNIFVTQLLDSLVTEGYQGIDAIADGYVKVVQGNSASNFSVQIDADGFIGGDIFRPFITVNLSGTDTLNQPSNFVF